MKAILTIESDLVDRLQREACFSKQSLQQIVNETLRKGLNFISKAPRKPYQTIPHSSAFVSGIDQNKLNQLADELELQAQLESYHHNDHP